MENELRLDAKKQLSKLGFIYFIGTLLIYGIQYLTMYLIEFISPDLAYENYDLFFILEMLPMYFIAMPLMGLLIKKIPATPLENPKKMKISHFFIAFMMCYAGVYLSNIIGTFITQFISILKGSPVSNDILTIASGNSIFSNILIMVILAPIAEELLFRKLLIDRLVMFGEGTAVFFSGLMFGLFHGNLNQFAYAFVLGAFFGFIYIKTKNIRYSIYLHMIINFMGSVIAILLLKNCGYDELLIAMEQNPAEITAIVMEHLLPLCLFILYAFILLGIVIAGIVLWILNFKKIQLVPTEYSIPKGKRFSTYFLNYGMLLFSAFWIIKIILQLFQ